jgi:hypothetical protein
VVFSGDVTYVALANSWIIINVGGGPTDDKPSVTLETPRDPDRVSHVIPQQSVILRWDGTAWRQVPTPDPQATHLTGVTTFAGKGAWATGAIPQDSPTPPPTIIERWDGTAWQRVPGVQPAQNAGGLSDVAATSPRNAWAVGSTLYNPLIEHWNGTSWQPTIGTLNGGFNAVSATSARNAWAVGSTIYNPLIEHWNGTAWQRIPSPNPGSQGQLYDVVAVTARDAWAVGDYTANTGIKALILHWDGTAWHRVPGVPGEELRGVAAVSAQDVWAVGGTGTGTLILHWNGIRWQRVAAP